jgi:hypothetical protein
MRTTRSSWWLAVVFAAAAGCGGGGSGSDAEPDGDVEEADSRPDGDGRDGDSSEVETDGPPVDNDGDTFPEGEDCDDGNPDVFPGATELCNGVDDNCDGVTDEDSADDASTWYADTDGDTFGDPDATRNACAQPAGYVANDDDCDDGDGAINPGTDEVCNGADDDCDGETDENGAIGATAYYPDVDGDGYGDIDGEVLACVMPTGYIPFGGDCDDGDAAVNPAADEVCNGVDDNCDGVTDESTATDALTFYRDADGDGYGDPGDTVLACAAPSGYVADGGDCDDTDAAVRPGAFDAPDLLGIDTNCDVVDGDLALAVFVSVSTGDDTATGLGTLNADGSLTVDAVATLARAIEIADACDPKCYVLIAQGTYDQGTTPLALADGVRLYAGYDTAWVRGRPIGATVITSSASPTVRADALTLGTSLELLTIRGPNVTALGGESIALLVTGTLDATLLALRAVEVNAGQGGPGATGTDGTVRSCSVAGGTAGTSFNCGTTTGGSVTGCTGGAGGASRCKSNCFATWVAVSNGLNGGSGTAGSNGTGGAALGGDMWGTFTGTDWQPGVSGSGTGGSDGTGGCGGGGGGWWQNYCAFIPDYCSWDLAGGAGGAGGWGGCGANGGGGGQQGGGSFGIVLLDSTLTLDTVGVRLGVGGTGGAGGNGGNGIPGGAGGSGVEGGFMTNCGAILSPESGTGGSGGNGGNGAGGGGGAGGNGGPSVGVVLGGTATIPVGVPTYSITGAGAGAAGAGGTGGMPGGGGTRATDGEAGRSGTPVNIQRF